MKGSVTVERVTKRGKVTLRYTQPSHSIVVGFMKYLYGMLSHSEWGKSDDDYEKMHALMLSSPTGRGYWSPDPTYGRSTSYLDYMGFNGECFGIVIGTDSGAVDPSDTKLGTRIGQGIARWGGPDARKAYGVTTDRWRRLWYARRDSDRVYQHTLALYTINSWGTPTVGPNGLGWDGTYLWHVEMSTDNAYQLDGETGAVITNWATPGPNPNGIAYDPDLDRVWINDQTDDVIYRCTPAGVNETSIPYPGAETTLWGLEYWNGYLWAISRDQWAILQINKATGAQVGSLPLPPDTGSYYSCVRYPTDCAFDGLLWYICGYSDEGGNAIWSMLYPDDYTQVEYGGCDVLVPVFSGANGTMQVRRCFTNRSGGGVTIRKVGLHAGLRPELIAADVLASPVVLADDEELRVQYTFGITV